MDLFRCTAVMQAIVSRHVEPVCCLCCQKKDFISVPYEPEDAEYLKKIQ